MKRQVFQPLSWTLSLLAACAAGAMLTTVPVFSAPQDDPERLETEVVRGHEAMKQEVLVKFRGSPGDADLARIDRDIDAGQNEEIGSAGVRQVRSRAFSTDTLLAYFERRADVAYVEPNYVVRAVQASVTPNDPYYGQLWGLGKIAATGAWSVSTGSRANVVAVIDSGIDYRHPDLAANVWSAPAKFQVRIGKKTVKCAAGTHGFNAIRNTCDPMDDNSHGSHVAGTIGAVGNNGIGVVGVNWTASLMGAKFLTSSGSGTVAAAINAIEFVLQAKAAFAATGAANVRVMNNSWGAAGGFSQALLDEIAKANAADILFVAAAGNSDVGADNDLTPFYPAGYNVPNVVAVAATDSADGLASFSNYGAESVDLGAPGVDILSTMTKSRYGTGSGTSMAAPHVAGAAALVLSKCSLNTAGVKTVILDHGDPVGSLAGKTVTGGRLNVASAISACAGTTP